MCDYEVMKIKGDKGKNNMRRLKKFYLHKEMNS